MSKNTEDISGAGAATAGSEHQESRGSGNSELVRGLSDTAQTIGASLQTMQQALVGNMQQAAQMTLSMNMMMEELVRRAVQVGVYAERMPLNSTELSAQATATTEPLLPYRCALRISALNRSPIPLLNMTVKLWFSKRPFPPGAGSSQSEETADSQLAISTLNDILAEKPATCEAGRTACLLGFGNTRGAVPNSIDTSAIPFARATLSDATYLPSGAMASTLLQLSVSTPEQLGGVISVEFTSPGTGKALVVEHKFGIRLLHFVACSTAVERTNQHPSEPLDAQAVKIDINRIRQVFSVPPADGVAPGMLLMLGFLRHDSDIQVGLRVKDMSDNSQSATCEWLLVPGSDSNELIRSLIPILAEELTAEPSPALSFCQFSNI